MSDEKCPECSCPTDIWKLHSGVVCYCINEFCGWNRKASQKEVEQFLKARKAKNE